MDIVMDPMGFWYSYTGTIAQILVPKELGEESQNKQNLKNRRMSLISFSKCFYSSFSIK